MDLSFVLSEDELFTLITLAPRLSAQGEALLCQLLPGAKRCSLNSLVEKKLARYSADELVLAPVIRMIADAMAQPAGVTREGDVYTVCSRFITLKCDGYPYKEHHIRITPIKE